MQSRETTRILNAVSGQKRFAGVLRYSTSKVRSNTFEKDAVHLPSLLHPMLLKRACTFLPPLRASYHPQSPANLDNGFQMGLGIVFGVAWVRYD